MEEFTAHEPPSEKELKDFEQEVTKGPEEGDALVLDLRHKNNSVWNTKVLDLILARVLEKRTGSAWEDLPERSGAYFLDIVCGQINRARNTWKVGQPHLNDEGEVESPEDIERRMVASKESSNRRQRAYTRRRSVSISPCLSSNPPDICCRDMTVD